MQFLNPIWLFAISGILVPIAIHLWNIDEGKTLKVGSIILLEDKHSNKANKLKINELLLLFLRCLLIIVIAFFLAEPVFTAKENPQKINNWILIPKEQIKPVYSTHKTKVDSLLNKGFEFHYFDTNFVKADFNKALADTLIEKNTTTDYWQKIDFLNKRALANQKIYLFTDDLSAKFYGEKPVVNFDLNWITYNTAKTKKWLSEAVFTDNKEILIRTGNTNADQIFYSREMIDPAKANANYKIDFENGTTKITSINEKDDFLIVDNNTLHIYLYSKNYIDDKRYLEAAINAIKQYTNKPIIVEDYRSKTTLNSQDWLFWLDDNGYDKTLLSKKINLLVYKKGKLLTEKTILKNNFDNENTRLTRFYNDVNNHDVNLWVNGSGKPILSKETINKATVYSFYSRFNPDFTTLVWDNNFPVWILKLLYQDEFKSMPKYDFTKIETSQIQPSFSKKALNYQNEKTKNDFTFWFWLAAFTIFCGERLLAYKKQIRNER